ncbi:biotin transporter BioY [Limosilactobacillus viscerum]|uniref:biotin transporter BioY n=1 Tax=Limosilactobacillus viscerum TaxID=2993450 RepID=UPI0024B8A882|nr:biotin transporter BioY [Limosilactobacillus viscerum]
MNTKRITRGAVMLALLIICSQLSIPLPGVPLTLQTFAVGLIATLLPVTDTLLVIISYLILGIIGLPIFANYTGGIGIIYSAVGGYLLGFIAYGLLTSGMLSYCQFSRLNVIIANLIGAAVQLLLGTLWLMYFNHLGFGPALLAGFVPFIIPGLIKIYLVMTIAQRLEAVVSLN